MNFDGPVPGMPGAFIRSVPDLPDHLIGGLPAGEHIYAKPGHLLMLAPGVGRFLVRAGTSIEFAAEADADPGMVTLVLHGIARGALIHQQGELPLHAATLVPPRGGRAVAVCGASGAGKSTLAAELSRRGWMLLADDTSRIAWCGNRPMAWPSRDTIKLWQDACEAMAIDVAALERVAAKLDKYYHPVPALDEPAELGTVFELTAEGEPSGRLSSHGEKMALLTRHTYRPKQIRPLGVAAAYVRIVGRVAGACRLLQLGSARAEPVAILADRLEAMLGM